MLVREFDERYGWQKWGLPNCAEWLAWRCGVSLSAAREKVRTAHALRALPAISAAFADGRSRIRRCGRSRASPNTRRRLAARVRARRHGSQVEERCRELRNAKPESAPARYTGGSTARSRYFAIARAAACGSRSSCRWRTASSSRARSRARSRRATRRSASSSRDYALSTRQLTTWRAQQADALVAIAKAYSAAACGRPGTRRRGGEPSARAVTPGRAAASRRPPTTIRSSCTWTPSALRGGGGAIRSADRDGAGGSRATAASSRSSRTSTARRSTSAASSARCGRRCGVLFGRATAAAVSRGATTRATSTRITSIIGRDGGETSLENHDAALHVSPHAGARGRRHDAPRRKRRHLLPCVRTGA